MEQATPKEWVSQAMVYALVTVALIVILPVFLVVPTGVLMLLSNQKNTIWLEIASGLLGVLFSLLAAGFIIAGLYRVVTSLRNAFQVWKNST